jgi:hypothetical protein
MRFLYCRKWSDTKCSDIWLVIFSVNPLYKILIKLILWSGYEICGAVRNYCSKGNLSSRLVFKNLKIAAYKTVILHGVLYGIETCT